MLRDDCKYGKPDTPPGEKILLHVNESKQTIVLEAERQKRET